MIDYSPYSSFCFLFFKGITRIAKLKKYPFNLPIYPDEYICCHAPTQMQSLSHISTLRQITLFEIILIRGIEASPFPTIYKARKLY